MSVTDTASIDAIALDQDTGECVLTITDHLDWDDDKHLLYLQEKINSYLAFIESGEITQHVADAGSRNKRIQIVMLYEPEGRALNFLNAAAEVISNAGFSLCWSIVAE